MVPLIISHSGAVHKDTIRRWKDFAPDIQVDWVRMAQNMLRYNVVIVGNSSTRAAGARKPGERSNQKNLRVKQMDLQGELPQPRREQNTWVWNLKLRGLCVCGLRARHLHTASGSRLLKGETQAWRESKPINQLY